MAMMVMIAINAAAAGGSIIYRIEPADDRGRGRGRGGRRPQASDNVDRHNNNHTGFAGKDPCSVFVGGQFREFIPSWNAQTATWICIEHPRARDKPPPPPLSSLSRVGTGEWVERGPDATDCRRARLLFSAWQMGPCSSGLVVRVVVARERRRARGGHGRGGGSREVRLSDAKLPMFAAGDGGAAEVPR